jgi:hypothetical protein
MLGWAICPCAGASGSACAHSDGPGGSESASFSVCTDNDGSAGIEITTFSAIANTDGPGGRQAAHYDGIRSESDGAIDEPMNVSMCAITHCLGTIGGTEGTTDVEDPFGVGDTIGVKEKGAGQADGGAPGVGSRLKDIPAHVTS